MRQTLRRMRSNSGVSEVIGTILILAMTVVLFASIIMWVSTIPTPQAAIRLDMDGQLTPIYDSGGMWFGANFTVQHRGGERLLGFQTSVLFIRDRNGTFETVTLKTRGTDVGVNYGIDGTNADWDSGETWAYSNYTVKPWDLITLTVVNNPSSTVVWTEKVQAPAGAHPPVFIEKWLDGDTTTAITRDTPLTALPFGIYAKIEDPDGDLRTDNVSVKFTFGPRATYRMYDDATHGDRVASDGIFTRVDPAILPAKSWDGGILILKAEDLAVPAHVTESRLIFQVLQNPNEPTGEGGSGAKGPQDLPWRSEAQAFAIYNETAWDGGKWGATETRKFKENEVVVVIVVSQYLRNVDLQNDLMFYDPDEVPQRPLVYSNAPYYNVPPYVRPVTTSSKPSTTDAFSWLEFTSDYFVYEYRFSTDSTVYGNDGVQLAYGRYYMEITLRANNVPTPRNQFQTVEAITVTPANGSAWDKPVVEFFTSSAHTIKTTQFNFTDTMYVRVQVNNTDGSVSTGDVTLSDYVGGVQIWERARGAPSPISAITTNGSTYYKFTIDLSIPNRDPWIAGLNAYGFRIKLLKDANEDYTLGAQVMVRGPRWSLDIVSAFDEFSHPVQLEKWYAMFNDNDRLWTSYIVDKWKPSSSSPPWTGGTFYTTVFSDLDEDGDLDVAVGIQNSYVWWYRNTDGAGHVWEKFQVDNPAGAQIRAISAGRIDLDTDNDLVVGTNGGEIYWYANDGAWTRSLIADLNQVIGAIKVADTDMDGDKDVIVGTQDSSPANSDIIIYRNNGGVPVTWTSSTMANNVGAIVYDLTVADYDADLDNDVIAAFGSTVRAYRGTTFAGTASVSCSPSLCLTADVGFVDVDPVGYSLMDLAVGTDRGELFLWERINGSTSWTAGKTTIIDLVDTTDLVSLRVGDVDGDLLDDIVVGWYASAAPITGEVRLFRTRSTGTAWDNKPIMSITGGASTPLSIRDVDIGDVDRGIIIDLSL